MRYVDDTLFLAKDDELKYVFDKFNLFHKNLKFTKNHFVDNNVHFLDITIEKADTDQYKKQKHTGQYPNFNGILAWNYKTLWIKSLYHCAGKLRASN